MSEERYGQVVRREKKFDFLVIGAQKSGTTALFEYLRSHPRIMMPPGKEAPFFTNTELYGHDLRRFIHEAVGNVSDTSICGKVTPHYMTEPSVPARIHNLLPDVKLISILRNPIDRAISHYRMTVRRGLEKRSIDQAFHELMQPELAETARMLPPHLENERLCYLAWSEYGRILEQYRILFPPDQLLILLTEELERDPAGTLDRILEFIGLAAGFRPANLGKRVFVGGGHQHLRWIKPMMQGSGLVKVWRLLPLRLRTEVDYRLGLINTVRKAPVTNASVELSPDMRTRVQSFLEHDIEKIRKLLKRPELWQESTCRLNVK